MKYIGDVPSSGSKIVELSHFEWETLFDFAIAIGTPREPGVDIDMRRAFEALAQIAYHLTNDAPRSGLQIGVGKAVIEARRVVEISTRGG